MPIDQPADGSTETLVWGDGADLLLILHASATGPRAYTGFAKSFEHPSWRIAVPAFTGYGSAPREDAAPKGHTARNSEIALAALDAHRAGRRFLFGHSMGGLIALRAALACQTRGRPVDGLTLYEPILHDILDPASPPDAEALAWDRDIIAKLAEDVLAGQAERGVRRFVESWNDVPWPNLPLGVRQQLIAGAANLAAETADTPGHGPDAVAVGALEAPTLILCGDRSPAFTRRAAVRAAETIPKARLITLAGHGHMAPLDVSDIVTAAIEEFLSAL